LISTNFDSLGSDRSFGSDRISFSENSFSVQPGEIKQIVAKIDISNLGVDTYKGYIFVTAEGATTAKITCNLSIRQNPWIKYSVLSFLFVILFITYWLLLRKNSGILFSILSFGLVFAGLIMLLLTVPFGDAVNTILVTIVVSPIIAFLISLLTTKRDLAKSIDETIHTYRKTMIENESAMLGKLMGELSTHYAEFQAKDWPNPQKLLDKVWTDSNKTKLISDTHIGLLAQYYYYVPVYNSVIEKIEGIKKYEKSDPEKFKELKSTFQIIRDLFLAAETVLYHALMYDLGFLQQNYLNRPNVNFPLHTQKSFEESLQKYEITKKGAMISKKVYLIENADLFNKGCVGDFNKSFLEMENKLNKFAKEIALAAED
jgi:hypothetical protein